MDQKLDFETTTATLKRVAPGFAWLPIALRQRLTPAALWTTIGALAISIALLVNAQADINHLKESSAESKKSVADLTQQLELLHEINARLAVMSYKVDTIATEVDRQREWREQIERAAEERPHGRQH